MQGNNQFDAVTDKEGSPFVWPLQDAHAMIDVTCRLKAQRCLGVFYEAPWLTISTGGVTLMMSLNDWEILKRDAEIAISKNSTKNSGRI